MKKKQTKSKKYACYLHTQKQFLIKSLCYYLCFSHNNRMTPSMSYFIDV